MRGRSGLAPRGFLAQCSTCQHLLDQVSSVMYWSHSDAANCSSELHLGFHSGDGVTKTCSPRDVWGFYDSVAKDRA